MELFLSTEEVSGILGVSRPTVIKYIQEGRLRAARTGKAYKITKPDLVHFARENGLNIALLATQQVFTQTQEKKTHRLSPPSMEADMLCQDPTIPLEKDQESEVLYYLVVCPLEASHELIIPVKSQKFFIGRHSLASLVIQDPFISNIHATLIYHDGFVKLLDQSTNGTQVGGHFLGAGLDVVIGDGDPFKMGHTKMRLVSAKRIDHYLGSGTTAAQHAQAEAQGRA